MTEQTECPKTPTGTNLRVQAFERAAAAAVERAQEPLRAGKKRCKRRTDSQRRQKSR